jgi:hypothetical protein
MEPTEKPRNLPYLNTYKSLGNIAVPTTGTMLLLVVALQFSRYPDEVNRLGLAAIALGIAVIGVAYYKLRREVNRLDGEISDKALSTFCKSANAMAMFGYSICMTALTLAHHP